MKQPWILMGNMIEKVWRPISPGNMNSDASVTWKTFHDPAPVSLSDPPPALLPCSLCFEFYHLELDPGRSLNSECLLPSLPPLSSSAFGTWPRPLPSLSSLLLPLQSCLLHAQHFLHTSPGHLSHCFAVTHSLVRQAPGRQCSIRFICVCQALVWSLAHTGVNAWRRKGKSTTALGAALWPVTRVTATRGGRRTGSSEPHRLEEFRLRIQRTILGPKGKFLQHTGHSSV